MLLHRLGYTRTHLRYYALAALAVLAALVIRLVLHPVLGTDLRYVSFVPAVLIAALYGGVGPGIVAIALGTILGNWFAPPGQGVVAMLAASLAFIAASSLGVWVTERARAGDLRANAAEAMIVAALKASRTGTWTWDIVSDTVRWDDTLASIYGRPPAEAPTSASQFLALVHPDDRSRVEGVIRAALADGADVNQEFRVLGPDGVRWISDRSSFVRDPSGQIVRMVGACADVTERKRAEDELVRRTRELEAVLATVPAGVWFTSDRDVISVKRNLKASALMRLPPGHEGSFSPKTSEKITNLVFRKQGQDLTPAELPLQRAMQGTEILGEDFEMHFDDGSIVVLQSSASPIRAANGEIVGAVAVSLDVTERRAAEEALRRSEERIRLAQEAGGIGFWEWNRTSNELYWSDRLRALLGLAPNVPADPARFIESIHPDDRERVRNRIATGFQAGPAFESEFRVIRADDGRVVWLANRTEVLTSERLVGVNFDITDRKAAEQELAESERRLRIAIKAGGMAVWELDVQNDRVHTTPELLAMLGFPPDASVDIQQFRARYAPGERDRIQAEGLERFLAGDRHIQSEFQYLFPGDEVRWLSLDAEVVVAHDGTPARAVGVLKDITERKRTEAALRELNAKLEARVEEEVRSREAAQNALAQAQKMEAIGQLTGGVAHDFNNLLQAVSGCLEMIGRRANDEATVRYVAAGRQAIDRGAKITQQLLAFARKQSLRPEVVELSAQIAGMQDLLKRLLTAEINLVLDLPDDLPPVEVDPTQLELAVLNLVVNSRDALNGRGRIAIRTFPAPWPPGVRESLQVGLCVEDDGDGIAPEVMSRIFEPFFTTKQVGKGTGLGLSQVYGFANQSGGTVNVDSTPGEGTRITILLPATAERPAAERPMGAALASSCASASILLAEDDPIVQGTLKESLEEHGYSVETASSGDEAWTMLEGGLAVDLVLSDVVMPGRLSGIDLARKLSQARPKLPIIISSAYSRDLKLPPNARFIAKPYEIDALLMEIEAVLPESLEQQGTVPSPTPNGATLVASRN